MRKFTFAATALCVVGLLLIVVGCSDRQGTLDPTITEQLTSGVGVPNPNPGQDTTALPMNLSFPIIWTSADSASLTLLDPYIQKTENITKKYTGTYPGMSDEEVDYLMANAPWYPQPPYANENTWVTDYVIDGANLHQIHFIDWGNPLENITARVGQRFPVEVALYERLGYAEFDELGEVTGFVGTTMEAFTMACLEYTASRDELFGTNKVKYNSCFATVLSTNYTVSVRPPNTWQEYEIRLDPAAGPSGKMNFASANGGWIPQEEGWHRITLTMNDPNISFAGAIVNNDEHYNMLTGEMLEELAPNKADLAGIFYNTTWVDIYVLPAGGGR